MVRDDSPSAIRDEEADLEILCREWAIRRKSCPFESISTADPAVRDLLGMRMLPDNDEIYVAWGHDVVAQVMRDSDNFIKPGPPWRTTRTLLSMNGEEHRQHREIVEEAFSPKAIGEVERSIIYPILNRLVDEFVGAGRADLVADYTSQFPFHVIRTMIGFDEADHDEFVSLAYPGADGLNEAWEHRVETFLQPRIDEARRHPRGDLMSRLVTAEINGKQLTDQELYQFLLLLIPAGADTTFAGSSVMFAGLLLNPDQLQLVIGDDRLVPRAVDEALRWHNPAAKAFLRTAVKETAVAGTSLAPGAVVCAHLSSHNRDESKYENASEYLITRDRPPRGIFGYGPHACLGMHLARAEMRAALRVVIARLTNLRLDITAATPVIRSDLGFASPATLPVLFDPMS
jgi:cytochrome P450